MPLHSGTVRKTSGVASLVIIETLMKGHLMTKRLAHSLEGYLIAVFEDLRWAYGSATVDWERDRNRSLHELVHRGERLLTIDLPALRKHLERCLEEGQYTPSNLPLSAVVSRAVQVPAFGRALYLKVFDVQGKLLDGADAEAINDLRQLMEGFGKLKNPCSEEAIDEEVKVFLHNENELRKPTLAWQSDVLYEDYRDVRRCSFTDGIDRHGRDSYLPGMEPDSSGPSFGDAAVLQSICDIIVSSFGDFHLERDDERIAERPQHGKGRVSNLKRDESKFSFADWPRKLDLTFPYDRYAVSDLMDAQHAENEHSEGFLRNFEAPSKLIAVPKTMSGPRLIGSEPNYHQWIQQLIRAQLESRIKGTVLRNCVSFGDQSPNRALALQGSRDGSITTVDLKSASDRLSCWTIERALRGNLTLLDRIHASRTRWMRNAINDAFTSLVLKKCFTQGSACTFPVQTIVYSMISIAAVLITEGRTVSKWSITRAARQVRVFGDDIVVPTTALPKLRCLLGFLQLSVNSNKTFSKGKFRESCGQDAYDGVDVTPARVKRFSPNPSHEVAQSMIEASNNFYKRGMWHTASWLQSHLGKFKLPTVPIRDSEKSIYALKGDGYQSIQGLATGHLKSRWNPRLQVLEYQVHKLASNSKKVPTQSAYDLTEFLFSARERERSINDLLFPREGGLGVVNKESAVMRLGWTALQS